MTSTAVTPTANPTRSLYRLKPWYAARLTPVLELLDRRGVRPDVVSAAGILAAAIGGVAAVALPAGPIPAAVVLAAAAARLAAANLDGNLARRRPARRIGFVVNEVGDRLADLALLAGIAWHVGGPGAGLLLLASCLPSWIALAGAAAGDVRRNGGPVGKTERAAACVLAALTGWWVPVALVVGVGSVLTAALRWRATARAASDTGRAAVAR